MEGRCGRRVRLGRVLATERHLPEIKIAPHVSPTCWPARLPFWAIPTA